MKHKQFLLRLIVAVLALLLASSAQSASYYVDSALGDDTTGDGTSGLPWKTITHAASVLNGTPGAGPDQLYIAAGTYDIASNGETFPITVNKQGLSLLGPAVGTATIAGDGSPINLLAITGPDITVQDLTFASAGTGISSLAGGLTLTGNTFAVTLTTGLYFYIHTAPPEQFIYPGAPGPER